MDCLSKDCDGTIEASTRIFLDLEAVPYEGSDDQYDLTITDLSPSSLNDEVHGVPMNLEAEFQIACSVCNRPYVGIMSERLMRAVGLQPIGDAQRTTGSRGTV